MVELPESFEFIILLHVYLHSACHLQLQGHGDMTWRGQTTLFVPQVEGHRALLIIILRRIWVAKDPQRAHEDAVSASRRDATSLERAVPLVEESAARLVVSWEAVDGACSINKVISEALLNGLDKTSAG